MANTKITSRVIADDAVTTAAIADDAITSALIADNAVGIPALAVSDGSNGQVLTTNGSGTLSFSTVSGTTINNNADNRIITGSGTANTLNGEANLTFDSSLVITKSEGAANSLNDQISLEHTNGTTGYHIKTIRAAANDNPDGIAFVENTTERMRIRGGGITFNGDTAAANTLDDYEEGTWTPAFYTYSGVTTTSITNHLATYTKIGNIVHLYAKISVTLSSLPGQTVTITGLPFAANNVGDQYAIIALGGDTANMGANSPKAHFRTNGSQLDGVYWNASSNTALWTYQSFDSPTFNLAIHGFYTTA